MPSDAECARPRPWYYGPSIPDYSQAKVFEKFYSLACPHSAKKSTGLGLAFVWEIAQLHHGRIELGQALGSGALAALTLPLVGLRKR